MRPGADLAQVLREYDLASYPRYIKEVRTKSSGVNGVQPPPTANGKQTSRSRVTVSFHRVHLLRHVLFLCLPL